MQCLRMTERSLVWILLTLRIILSGEEVEKNWVDELLQISDNLLYNYTISNEAWSTLINTSLTFLLPSNQSVNIQTIFLTK